MMSPDIYASTAIMAPTDAPTTINALPNEIFTQILTYLDTPPPSSSISTLRDQPHLAVTSAPNASLKAASCVSKIWREGTRQILFKHAQFHAPKGSRTVLVKQIQPFLDFIIRLDLAKIITSFTLIAPDKKLRNTINGKYEPDCFSSFWHVLFTIINPAVVLIIAPPQALGALTSCNVVLSDEWCISSDCHYFRLEKPGLIRGVVDDDPMRKAFLKSDGSPDCDKTRPDETDEPPRAKSSALIRSHSWTKLLINEGSYIRVYATYEYWQRQVPSILEDLLGKDLPRGKSLISPTIRSLSYIAVFPTHSHFAAITSRFPRVDDIYIQLVPRNDILQDPTVMRQIEAEDLWMERNGCYALLQSELFQSPPYENYRFLRVFESGDPADREAWNMAVAYVKRLQHSGWAVASEGVFVKDPNYPKPATPVGEEDEDSFMLKSELLRWAWNGVADLPVAASRLYLRQW